MQENFCKSHTDMGPIFQNTQRTPNTQPQNKIKKTGINMQ